MMIDYIPAVLRFNKKKLVLDLDETLISASQKHQGRHDLSVRITINGTPSTFFIKKRPHVDFFLETVFLMVCWKIDFPRYLSGSSS